LRGREEGGDGLGTPDGQVIAMGLGGLFDQAVSPEQTQFPGYGAGAARFFRLAKLLVRRVEETCQVAIATAMHGELAPGHGLQEGQVFRGMGI
jgi:hypothetical protein